MAIDESIEPAETQFDVELSADKYDSIWIDYDALIAALPLPEDRARTEDEH